jgi:hypothetical protein
MMAQFLPASRHLLETRHDLLFKSDFEATIQWLDGLRAGRQVVNIDLDNIEDVFSLSEASHQTRSQGGTSRRVNLRHLITETVDLHCCLQDGPDYYHGEPAYDVFLNELVALVRIVMIGYTAEISKPIPS